MTGASDAPLPGATPTLRETVRVAEARLRDAGVGSPDLDARLLVQHALGLTRDRLLIQANARLTPAMVQRVMGFVARRAAREPVSRILGRREFWSLDFALDASTLDPRPDTETVVEAVLAEVADRTAPLRLLDLGTGTGCLLLALLSELPNATGLGIDIAPDAVGMARRNAAALGLRSRAEFAEGDWGAGLPGGFDVVVSNPPYIADGEIDGLEPEVSRFDPSRALAGGPDGLDAYRALAPQLARLLVPGGLAALEVGAGQAADVAAILGAAGAMAGVESGLAVQGTRRDLSGVERCVVARRGR